MAQQHDIFFPKNEYKLTRILAYDHLPSLYREEHATPQVNSGLEAAIAHNFHQEPLLMKKFRAYVKSNFAATDMQEDARLVRFYASQLDVHPNHLNAVVKRTTGEPALKFIHKEIIKVAKSLLIETGLSVKQVAYKLVFKEPSHFNAFFRKYTNLSPAGYRQQIFA